MHGADSHQTQTRSKLHGRKANLLALKDPNAPKRGLSAYMFFANEQRENVRAENPGIAFGKLPLKHSLPKDPSLTIHFHTGQVGKVLGERWKALSQKQRDPYEAKAAADKKRYEDEKVAYQANSGNGEEEEEED